MILKSALFESFDIVKEPMLIVLSDDVKQARVQSELEVLP
jgi:hypothetical protein